MHCQRNVFYVDYQKGIAIVMESGYRFESGRQPASTVTYTKNTFLKHARIIKHCPGKYYHLILPPSICGHWWTHMFVQPHSHVCLLASNVLKQYIKFYNVVEKEKLYFLCLHEMKNNFLWKISFDFIVVLRK